MAVNIRKVFRENCGPHARFVAYQMRKPREGSSGFPVVCIGFSVGKRKFELDGVIHHGESPDERLRNAVLKIAAIARNVKAIMAAPDGAGQVRVERALS